MIVISASDLMGPNWRFLEGVGNPSLRWETHSGLPRTLFERKVGHAAPARFRAALSAVHSASGRQDALLVSHLPRMAEATNLIRRLLAPRTPHIAFAFTFTEIPGARRRAIMSKALAGVDEFVMFSRFETELYAELFGIEAERLRFLPWAVEPPTPGPVNPVADLGDYLCAIGSEGRDYALLAEAMRRLPEIRMAIVPRAHVIKGIDFPPNMRVFTEMAPEAIWRLTADSLGMVLPLRSRETACGHVTMVAAQHLGVPLAVSASRSVEGYVTDGVDGLVFPPKDLDAMIDAIRTLHGERTRMKALAATAQQRAAVVNHPIHWVRYFQEVACRFGFSAPDSATGQIQGLQAS